MNSGFRRDIAWAGTAACLLEAAAPKVGNVNRLHDFADCRLEDFLLSGAAIGEPLGWAGGRGVGETVLEAVSLTRQLGATNTNLGIILLTAPLAKAWGKAVPAGGRWRTTTDKQAVRGALAAEMASVLTSLTIEDARLVYQAIRLAAPGGLGQPAAGDVNREDRPAITLLAAMALAAERDLIAREYASGFKIILDSGLPLLEQALGQGLALPEAIAHAQIGLLSRYPDTLIARKAGAAASAEVQARARVVWENGGWGSGDGRTKAAELDHWLRQGGNRLNPGTTADILTAVIFVLLLEDGPALWRQTRRIGKPAAQTERS